MCLHARLSFFCLAIAHRPARAPPAYFAIASQFCVAVAGCTCSVTAPGPFRSISVRGLLAQHPCAARRGSNMGALAKLQARIHELEKLNEQLSVWKPREKLSRTLELSNLVSRFNALAEAKVSIKFELAPISGTVSLIMNAMMLFEVSLLHDARTGCEFYRKKGEKGDAEEAAVMAEFRTALLTREADPVEITLTVDGGARRRRCSTPRRRCSRSSPRARRARSPSE